MEAIAITQLLIIVALQLFLQQRSSPTNQRRACLKRKRIDWECRAQLLEDSNSFERCYKMSRASFDALLDLLSPALVVGEQQSMNRTGVDHVTPVNKLQMFLRYISGGSYHDIIAYSGVGKTTFHDCIQEVMDALLANPQLQIKFPEDEEGVESLDDGFQGVSNGGVMVGCVGAINGWLCPIIVPSVKEAPKVRSFYSGHYRCYGVYVQACCDHISTRASSAVRRQPESSKAAKSSREPEDDESDSSEEEVSAKKPAKSKRKRAKSKKKKTTVAAAAVPASPELDLTIPTRGFSSCGNSIADEDQYGTLTDALAQLRQACEAGTRRMTLGPKYNLALAQGTSVVEWVR